MSKIAVFVDVQNIYYTVKSRYGCHFNYAAFWQHVTADRQLIKAYAYAIDKRDQKQMNFQKILRDIGFEIKLKPFIKRQDGSAKGDWDVGITIDILEAAASVDMIALASGDGDFDILLNQVHSKYGVTTLVYGVPDLTANSLINAAQEFIPITELLLLQ